MDVTTILNLRFSGFVIKNSENIFSKGDQVGGAEWVSGGGGVSARAILNLDHKPLTQVKAQSLTELGTLEWWISRLYLFLNL